MSIQHLMQYLKVNFKNFINSSPTYQNYWAKKNLSKKDKKQPHEKTTPQAHHKEVWWWLLFESYTKSECLLYKFSQHGAVRSVPLILLPINSCMRVCSRRKCLPDLYHTLSGSHKCMFFGLSIRFHSLWNTRNEKLQEL